MIENATVSIYSPVITQNDEGTDISTWGYKQVPALSPVESFRADVQPHTLTIVEQNFFGITDQVSNTKIMFCAYSGNVDVPNRAKVVSDFDGKEKYYSVRAGNIWPGHMEALLVPVVGE